MQFARIVRARPAVRASKPFQNDLGVAIHVRLRGNAEIIGHYQEAE